MQTFFKRLNVAGLVALAEAAQATARRFPFVLALGFVAAGLSIKLQTTANHDYFTDVVFRTLISAILGIPLSLTCSFLCEQRNRSIWIKIAAFLGSAAIMAATFYAPLQVSEKLFMTLYAQFWLAAHLSVALAAPNNRGEDEFWAFNQKIFGRILLSGMYSGVLYLGLMACVATFNRLLLQTGTSTNTFAYLFYSIAFVFNTWFFLAGFPRNGDNADFVHPKGVRVFTEYLLIPLVFAYLAILYLYMGSITVQMAWPKGTVGYMVSAFSLVGILTYLIVEPATKSKSFPWVRFYGKAFFVALAPLSALLLLATYRRIHDYGVTEPRYFLVVLGLWVMAIAFYFALPTKRNLRVIPASLLLLCIVNTFGPWSAFQVSERSQLEKLKTLLASAKETQRTAASDKSENKSKGLAVKLRGILDYLNEFHQTKDLELLFPNVKVLRPDGKRRYVYEISCDQLATLNLPCASYDPNTFISFYADDGRPLTTSGYNYAFEAYLSHDDKKEKAFDIAETTYKLSLDAANNKLLVNKNGVIAKFDLTEAITKSQVTTTGEWKPDLIYVRTDGYAFGIKQLSANHNPDEKTFRINNINGYLLIK